jgi:hypothetical protein
MSDSPRRFSISISNDPDQAISQCFAGLADAASDLAGTVGDDLNAIAEVAQALGEEIAKFDDTHGNVLTRAAGAAQLVGGISEVVGGGGLVGLGGAATATGVGAPPGVAVALEGIAVIWNGGDNAQTGFRQLISGKVEETATSQAVRKLATGLGVSEDTVNKIKTVVNLGRGLGKSAIGSNLIKGGIKSSAGRLPRSNGEWVSGTPGHGLWKSNVPAVNAITNNQPIPYINGKPDFSAWSKGEIYFKRGTLTGVNSKDFLKAFKKISQIKNLKYNKDAKQLLKAKGLTLHHLDSKSIELVPSALHNNVPHIGAASGLKRGVRVDR